MISEQFEVSYLSLFIKLKVLKVPLLETMTDVRQNKNGNIELVVGATCTAVHWVIRSR